MNEHPTELNEGPSPARSFLGYSSGSAGIAILRQIMVFFPLYFYCPPPEGKGNVFLCGGMVGLALCIGRLMDVLSDPLVGYLSDRTSHRWGRDGLIAEGK